MRVHLPLNQGVAVTSPVRHLHIAPRSLLAAFCISLLGFAMVFSNTVKANTFNIITREGPWLLEKDFDAEPLLHARDGQTVLLELEQNGGKRRGGKGKPGQNTLRISVEEENSYRYCLSIDEPHIERFRLSEVKANGNGRKKKLKRGNALLELYAGDDCGTVNLLPGSYIIDAFHNPRTVPDGKVAFLRSPDLTQLEGDPLTSSTATLAFMAWKGPNGKFVQVPNGKGNLNATATTVDEYAVWRLDGTKTFKLADGAGGKAQCQSNTSGIVCPPPLFVGPQRKNPNDGNCNSRAITFYFEEATSKNFYLIGQNTVYTEDGIEGFDAGFTLDSNEQVVNTNYPNYGSRWDVGYRGFDCSIPACDATQLKLQTGEVALFANENFVGPAIVFSTSVPDFSVYAGAASLDLGIGDNAVASVRVGPDTIALLHSNANYGGNVLGLAEDTPSLAGMAVGTAEVSSMAIKNTRQYVIDSNGCEACDLPGVDLSDLALISANFKGANLEGANLSGTSLFNANLEDTNISGATVSETDFSEANLRCTDLSDNDLTTAAFDIEFDTIVALSDFEASSILSLNVVSGEYGVIADPQDGGSPIPDTPQDMVNFDGGIAVVDNNRVYKIVDGVRTLVSSSDRGNGPEFLTIVGIAADSDESLLVTDSFRGTVFRVDTTSGDRAVVSSPGIGDGPALGEVFGIATTGDGGIFVVSGSTNSVLSIDPDTGDRTVISSASQGTGPALESPWDIAIGTDDTLYVTSDSSVLGIDPTSGNRRLVSGAGQGSGPALQAPLSLVVSPGGDLLVADALALGVMRIDTTEGDRILVVPDDVTLLRPSGIAVTGLGSWDGNIATDYSCRLNLARSSLAVDTLPLSLWRYLDLRGATITGTEDITISTIDNPLNLSGALLNGAKLSGSALDGADLGCATAAGNKVCTSLQGVDLTGASLKQASMENALLQGASLSNANLDAADLTGAQLLALMTAEGGDAADISGAFMRNVSLQGADLTGVTANNLNFFSASTLTADASNANLTSARFNNAYLAGANFNGAVLQSTEWNQAVLVGANFTNSDLSRNTTAGERTDFTGAYLQGSVFDNTTVTGAVFTSSYWDLLPADPSILNIQMQISNLSFNGYWNDTSQLECVAATYPNDNFSSPMPPVTDSSNKCPDNSDGPCTFMEQPVTPITQAIPLSALDPDFPGTDPNQCVLADLCWQIESSFCSPAL